MSYSNRPFRTILTLATVSCLGACSLLVLEDDLTPDLIGTEGAENAVPDASKPTSNDSGGTGQGGAGEPTSPQNGSGGMTHDPGQLGSACGEASDCDSDFCVDGVCCGSACDGVCEACGADGECDDTPTDDEGCGTISCSVGNNECVTYETQITQNRCAAFGACKTSDNCGTTDVENGTPCTLGTASTSVCRSGLCSLPQVECDGAPCTIDGTFICCQHNNGQSCTGVCEPTSLGNDATSSTPRRTQITCDAHEDCRPGTLCALTSAASSFIGCEPNPNRSGPGVSVSELCQSPTMPEQPCSNGGTCDSYFDPFFDGTWKFCTIP